VGADCSRAPPDANDSFHIYEIRADGAGLRRLTSGRYHDVHPIALPGGKIAFVSTRAEVYSCASPARQSRKRREPPMTLMTTKSA